MVKSNSKVPNPESELYYITLVLQATIQPTLLSFCDYMSFIKPCSYIRTCLTQAQINSHSIPKLDPIDSNSS